MGVARHALICRQVELLDEVVRGILALPLDQRLHNVARYYRAYGLQTAGDCDRTRLILDGLIDTALPEHKPRIILGLAGCHLVAGDLDESARTYVEAGRAATEIDPLSKCSALRGLALIRSYNGDHEGSLADLERLFPVMRSFAASYPEDYRDYLNNLAYELGEVGRIDEAKAAINVALRSPYASRFPDWAETKQELETKQRRVFLPLVFAPGSPAAAPVIPAIPETAVAAVARPERNAQEQASPEASAPAQPESQPDIQTSAARRNSPEPKRNRITILVVLARLNRRRLKPLSLMRQSLKPTFEAEGCARSPRARAPPFDDFLFF